MFEFLTAAQNTPFSVALAVMLGIAVLEGIGSLLGFALSHILDSLLPEVDVDFDADISSELETPSPLSRLLGWLRVGEVPMLMLLVIFLTAFGLIGLGLQSFSQATLGFLIPGIFASLLAFLLSLPIVRLFGNILNKIMPKDETDAVTEESLVGRIATITLGTATQGSPAEARVRDIHGTTHYVMVEPESEDAQFSTSSSVLLLRKEGAKFIGIANPNPVLTDEQTEI